MSWTTSTPELRTLLSDGPTDRLRFRKAVIGEIDGVNTLFKTFEFRRVTNFTTATGFLGVFKNGTNLTLSGIATDDPPTGIFTVNVAPVRGDVLEAVYYAQWFTDTELGEFMTDAMRWLGFGSDITTLEDGLRPAALQFGAHLAYMKMAIRWREYYSEVFRTEDSPQKAASNPTNEFLALAKSFGVSAQNLRDQFYTRQGQSLAPLTGFALGNVRDQTPSS